MYNRYIPQADGSYRRSAVREPNRAPSWKPPEPEVPPCPPPEQPPAPVCRPNCPAAVRCSSPKPRSKPRSDAPGVESFFRQLLPGDFCTEDLLVVLLLLLMYAEGSQDNNTALLTLALYLFL